MREVVERLCNREDLSMEESTAALETLLVSNSPEQIAAFLVLLRAKGETAAEMAGLAMAMQNNMVKVDAGNNVVDIVGTGGDSVGTVNISTGSTILAAAAGAKVAKHGNRSVSSQCGSADVLEELGVAIDLNAAGVARTVRECGVGFMFAPTFHPAMAKVVPVRKALRVRTAFNMLGPMLNPAGTKRGLIGVYDMSIAPLMADSLRRLGYEFALVVNSQGVDELTPVCAAEVMEVTPGGVKSYSLDPAELGIPRCDIADLIGGDRATNAAMLRDAFGGAKSAVADALILNAGVALAAAGVAQTSADGVAMARDAQQAGKAGDVLQEWGKLSQEMKAAEAVAA